MVHLRLNETEPNPNPHVNFITALPMPNSQDQEEARQLLRALAAQVRPVMKAHGLVVNSLEEYEHNSVFAGRNWNNGETVELVLRSANGLYCPTSWLMSTLCHELAHIKHMNHGPAFQALWARLRREVRQLQDKGYYGDGYWSSGTRLADSARVSGDGIEAGDFPEYMCGGAQSRARPSSLRRRRATQGLRETVPSLHTGRQTAKRRKAGGRVTSKFAFAGEGKSIANDAESSKGRRAASNRAREERALAAEKRLKAIAESKSLSKVKETSEESSESESEVEFVEETDSDRRRALLSSEKSDDTKDGRSLGRGLSWKDFENEFQFNSTQTVKDKEPANHGRNSKTQPQNIAIIELTDDSDVDDAPCDIPAASGSVFTTKPKENHKGKQKTDIRPISGNSQPEKKLKVGLGNLVKNEIEFRKKEALGLAPLKNGQRTLGEAPKANKPRKNEPEALRTSTSLSNQKWDCLVCTLENRPEHLACAACATPKGENTYHTR